MTIYLNIHGAYISIESDSNTITQWVKFDFAHFLASALQRTPDITLQINHSSPPPLPSVPAVKHTGNYVVFQSGASRIIEYPGGVQCIHHSAQESATFYGLDAELLYEKAYLFIQSRIGELLDNRGLHRVHGLGFQFQGKSILYLMPMGGGKSTLALKLSQIENLALYSDDTPVIDECGNIIPFPTRLGVITGEEPQWVPKEHLRSFARQSRVHKTLIHPDAIKSWAKSPGVVEAVFCGRWTGAQEPSVLPISKLKLFGILFRDCVVGVGLPQVVEFFLRGGVVDFFQKSWIAMRRLKAIVVLCAKAQGYEIHVSKDLLKNLQLLIDTLTRDSSRCPGFSGPVD